MAGRTGEHEQMPDKMTVADALIPEKDDAGGVGNAAGEKVGIVADDPRKDIQCRTVSASDCDGDRSGDMWL